MSVIVAKYFKCCHAVSPIYSGGSLQALYKDTLAALQELLKSVLAKDPTPDGLQNIFKVKPAASANALVFTWLFNMLFISFLKNK